MSKYLTYEHVKKYIEVESQSNCKLVSKIYISATSLLDIECACGNLFSASFNKFKSCNKRQCNECGTIIKANNIRNSFEDIKTLFDNYGYKIISNQNNRSIDNLEAIDKSGYYYLINYYNLKQGKKPSAFSSFNYFTIQNIKMWIKINAKDFVLKSNEYISAKLNLNWECNKCQNNWEANWDSIRRGSGCPKCASISNGEDIIVELLKEKNVDNIPQFKFLDCKNKRSLPFDFYLPIYNTCIEVQGIQHYEPIKHFGGENQYKQRKINDQIKRDYCDKNNIKLIEIPYWNFNNIEQILLKELNIV